MRTSGVLCFRIINHRKKKRRGKTFPSVHSVKLHLGHRDNLAWFSSKAKLRGNEKGVHSVEIHLKI